MSLTPARQLQQRSEHAKQELSQMMGAAHLGRKTVTILATFADSKLKLKHRGTLTAETDSLEMRCALRLLL
jgi:hypothetical protein